MILDEFRLDGKVAMITGASRGLGRAMAEALAETGADVVLAARTADALEEVAAHIRSLGRKALPVPTDVARDDDLERLVQTALDHFGRIDILVNNAGTTARHPSEEFPINEFDRVMRVNVRSVFLLSQKVAKVMIRQGGPSGPRRGPSGSLRGGKIINIASLQSEIAGRNIPAYTASKGAVRQLTRQLAVEWAKYNINVNAIGPGYMRTEMTEPLYQDPERNRIVLERVAIKRWGEPADIKGAVVYLASRASDYVTGQILYVDGGWLAQ